MLSSTAFGNSWRGTVCVVRGVVYDKIIWRKTPQRKLNISINLRNIYCNLIWFDGISLFYKCVSLLSLYDYTVFLHSRFCHFQSTFFARCFGLFTNCGETFGVVSVRLSVCMTVFWNFVKLVVEKFGKMDEAHFRQNVYNWPFWPKLPTNGGLSHFSCEPRIWIS